MKMKKLIAVGAAAAMSMAMCVNVFAATELTRTETDSANKVASVITYDEATNAVQLPATVVSGEETVDNRAFMSADGQLTVILAKTADANTNSLDATKLQYINQGVKNDTFWASMGAKDTLELDTDYTLRIGTPNASGEWDIKELTFKLTQENNTITVKWGDVNDDGSVNGNDSGAILNFLIGGTKTYGEYTINEVFANTLKWGDVNNDGSVNGNDSGAILNFLIGGTKTYGDYTIDKDATITK